LSSAARQRWKVTLQPRLGVERFTKSADTSGANPPPARGAYSGREPLVAFLPPAYDSQQYLGLLREALQRTGIQVRDLPRLLSADWVRENAGPSRVLHFHMPAYDYAKNARSREEVTQRLRTWETGIEQARSSGFGLVWTAHNLYPHDAPYRDLHHRARQCLLRHATAVIAHCHRAAEEVRRHFGGTAHITVIPHPHYRDSYDEPVSRDDARERLGLPRDAVIYLSLGLIRAYKGHDRLIRAFSTLDDPKARLIIAGGAAGAFGDGEGNLVAGIRAAASADPRIILRADRVPHGEIPVFFGACDFAVFAYSEILTSGAVVLAQSMERPVIAPSLGCLPEMVPDGTGLLYDPRAEKGLEDALRSAYSLSPDAGPRGWQAIRRFDWRSTALATTEVYGDSLRATATGFAANVPPA
jgi:beta-1,4-mannosyltransferase